MRHQPQIASYFRSSGLWGAGLVLFLGLMTCQAWATDREFNMTIEETRIKVAPGPGRTMYSPSTGRSPGH